VTKISDFSIEVPAKWVLTGEHSVLRGKRAIAFPHPGLSLQVVYRKQKHFSITANPFQSVLRSLIGRAIEFLGQGEGAFDSGEITLKSGIPIGAGLGSSAALCTAIARLVIWRTDSDPVLWIPLSTHLEDVFHGKSSGMDVNAIAIGRPIEFTMESGAKALTGLERLPRFELYDSGLRGQTIDCVEKVKHWRGLNPHLCQRFDQKMDEAGALAKEGLLRFQHDPTGGEDRIAQAMNDAQHCFETWGLLTPELIGQKHELLKQGALAVKLTGAGLGGFWVALWRGGSAGLDISPEETIL
jgi:mevalonate kinase